MALAQNDIIKRLVDVDERERKLVIERSLAIEKALRSNDVDTIYKAQNYLNQYNLRQTPQTGEMKSMVMDPFEAANSMGYFFKPASLSFEMLRGMARAPIISAIIKTRKDQVAEYCKPQVDRYSPGFVFKKKGVKDQDELSDADRRYQDKLTEFILHCGDEADKWDLDDFETFVRKIVDDSLTLDQATFEVIPTRSFEPTQFVAVDGATFRLADTYLNEANAKDKKRINGYLPSYVQLYQGQIIAEFYPWELCLGIRNPSTNIYHNGYGRGELEDLVQTTTAMLNSDSYNAKFFRHGSAPKGALLVKKGNINRDRISELRRDWNSMMSGVDNMHKTPVLDAESVEWLDMQKNNRDMEFSKYQEYLIRLGCANYKISPEEIGFPLGGTENKGIGNKAGGEHEKKYSKSKGLKPLLVTVQGWLNKYVIGPKTNFLWEFQFAGIDDETAKEEEERLTKAATTYMTVDEVRIGKGMKPLPNGEGKIILNPIISQMRQQKQQMEMQNAQGEQEQAQQQEENKNPFLVDENDPFAKGFHDWFQKEYVIQ